MSEQNAAPPCAGGAAQRRQPMTGAQSLVRSLEEVGVEIVFGIPGGAILPLYDPLFDTRKIRHVLVRHEQGAGHAATGYAQATGRVGVCMATSGPGATNLVTPIADAYMDSVPIVAITGQVPRGAIGTDAFQEADISGITMPITKHNFLVQNAEDIPRTIAEAFHLASTGRPGPVLVDVPKDVLQADTTFSWPPQLDLPGYRTPARPSTKAVREAVRLIRASRKPVLYVGGGVLKAGATEELAELAELTDAPVVTTLMARGAFPDSHPHNLGMPGMHGTVAAVTALQKSRPADRARHPLRRPGDRQARHLRPRREGAARRHRPGRDRQEPGRRRLHRRRREGRAARAGRGARQAGAPTARSPTSPSWWSTLDGLEVDLPARLRRRRPTAALAPQYVIERLGEIAGPDAIYVAGVGQHQMWAAQFVSYEKPGTWINSGGLGTMGFAVPGRDGRQGRRPGHHGVGDRRRRLLPDDQPGARDLRARGHPGQGRHHQQRQPRHGPAVADALLQRALLQHRPARQPQPEVAPPTSPTS